MLVLREGLSIVLHLIPRVKSDLTNICLSNDETVGLSWSQLRLFWCQNKWHHEYDRSWQVLCHVYSAVIWTSKCPCQISPKPLIMSLFFNFTAPGSSILFSIRGIILRLLTGSWQFQNDVSHLPLVHSLKAWLLARCCSACQGSAAAMWLACICNLRRL